MSVKYLVYHGNNGVIRGVCDPQKTLPEVVMIKTAWYVRYVGKNGRDKWGMWEKTGVIREVCGKKTGVIREVCGKKRAWYVRCVGPKRRDTWGMWEKTGVIREVCRTTTAWYVRYVGSEDRKLEAGRSKTVEYARYVIPNQRNAKCISDQIGGLRGVCGGIRRLSRLKTVEYAEFVELKHQKTVYVIRKRKTLSIWNRKQVWCGEGYDSSRIKKNLFTRLTVGTFEHGDFYGDLSFRRNLVLVKWAAKCCFCAKMIFDF